MIYYTESYYIILGHRLSILETMCLETIGFAYKIKKI